ncbi:MAG: methionine ABC transporter ATP-binding protein [Acinetobacter sp.]
MIVVKNLDKSYPLQHGEHAHVLKKINLNVQKGSITAIVGPSGSGKSTLSKCLSLLEQPTSGEILLNNTNIAQLSSKDLKPFRQKIGMIFQSAALLSRRTAAENIALPLEYLGVVDQQIEQRVNELLESVGLLHKANQYPHQLSGGQKQRVAIARALALKPEILISDEATSGLDPDATRSILNLLKQLQKQLGLTVVLITHEMDVVRQIADNVAVLSQGEIREFGTVIDLIRNPSSTIGQQILPLQTDIDLPDALQPLQILWGAQTPENWLSQLTLVTGIEWNVHTANIEQIHDQQVGKILISLDKKIWQTENSRIQQALQKLAIDVSEIPLPKHQTDLNIHALAI